MAENTGGAEVSCTTHHNACDCREAKFRELEAEVERLKEERAGLYADLTGQEHLMGSKIEILEAQNKRYREALGAYTGCRHCAECGGDNIGGKCGIRKRDD